MFLSDNPFGSLGCGGLGSNIYIAIMTKTQVKQQPHKKADKHVSQVFQPKNSKDDFPTHDVAFLSALVFKSLKLGKTMDNSVPTVYDKWESTILSHICHRQLYYGLPSISTNNGLWANNLSMSPVDGSPVADANIDGAAITYALETTTYGLNRKINLQGRYNIYTGLINDSISLPVEANSSSIWLICFRPDQYNAPVLLMEGADNITASVNTEFLEWTENPFYGASNFFPSVYSSKLKKKREEDAASDISVIGGRVGSPYGAGDQNYRCTDLLQMPGGYELEVEHVNRTAYTSTAFKLRTSSNTIHDFVQLYDNIQTDSINLGTTSGFQESKSAYMAISGTRWSTVNRYYNSGTLSPQPPDLNQSLATVQNCIMNDYPVFQIVCTNSGPSLSNITLNFRVAGWHGIAPTNLAFSGSMPYQTVPFVMPSWPESCKLVGSVKGHGNEIMDSVVTAALTSTSNLVPHMATSSPVRKQISSSPSVRGRIVVPESRGTMLSIMDKVGSGASKVANKVGESLLKKAGEAAERGAEKAFSSVAGWLERKAGGLVANALRIGPALEEVAPLLITA